MIINQTVLEEKFDYLDKAKFNESVTLSFQPPPIEIVFRPGDTFEEIAKEHQEKMREAACNGMASLLSQVDELTRANRDRGAFHNGHSETKKLLCWCGEVNYKRRVYTDREDNTRYLTDEILGLEKAQGVSLDILLRALTLSGEGSYRKVSHLIEEWTGVRRAPETYRRWVLRTGKYVEEQEKAERFLMFEDPSLMRDEDRVARDFIFLEADGCYIYMRDGENSSKTLKASLEENGDDDKKKNVSKKEVRLGLWYEGKRPRRGTYGNKEWEVTGKTYFGGFMNVEEFWELAAVVGDKSYGLGPNTLVVGNGDGAPWIGPHFEDFSRNLFVLCRYHWKRDIFRLFTEENARKLIGDIEAGDREKAVSFLDDTHQACSEKDTKKQKGITKLKTYLLNNWEGIQNYSKLKEYLIGKDPALARVGVIEGHIYQVLYLRFESRGGCWSKDGLNALFRVFTAKLNGALDAIIKSAGWKGLLKTWVMPEKDNEEQRKRADTGFSRGAFPILRGPLGKPIDETLKGILHPVSPILALR